MSSPYHDRPVPHDLEALVPGDMTEEERKRRWFAYMDAREKAVKEFEEARSEIRRSAVKHEWDEPSYNTTLGELQVSFHEAEIKDKEILKPPLAAPTGSPGSFRIERTTTDKVLDDLERTWHRIESDMSTRMQEALGILKHVMGYYYEEPCVVVWDNSSLVGVAVYGTSYDVNIGIRDTHIKELASFTHKPGVGRLLVEEVIRIGREESSDIVSVSYGPGARGFYESLGFVKGVYYPEEATLMMKELKSGN